MGSSCSAIADAIVSMLASSSVLGSGAVSKAGYELLESAASAAAMVKFRGFYMQPSNFGIAFSERWDFEIRCFVRYYGDPQFATNRTWTVTNNVVNCLKSDPTLQNTVDTVNSIEGNTNPEETLTIGGATWLPVTMRLSALIL